MHLLSMMMLQRRPRIIEIASLAVNSTNRRTHSNIGFASIIYDPPSCTIPVYRRILHSNTESDVQKKPPLKMQLPRPGQQVCQRNYRKLSHCRQDAASYQCEYLRSLAAPWVEGRGESQQPVNVISRKTETALGEEIARSVRWKLLRPRGDGCC